MLQQSQINRPRCKFQFCVRFHIKKFTLLKLANSLRFRNNLNVKGISKTDAYEQFEIANAVIDQVSKPKQVDALDPFPLFYPNTEHSILTLNGFGIYHDEDHVSPTGARLMKDLVKPILQDCLKDY